MAVFRSNSARNLTGLVRIQRYFSPISRLRSYSNAVINGSETNCHSLTSILHQSKISPWNHGSMKILRSSMVSGPAFSVCDTRSVTTQEKASPQLRQMGTLQVSMLSPGFIYEPNAPREKIPFWRI